MSSMEKKDVVQTTYEKMVKSFNPEVEEDAFYQYFYNLLETGMNYSKLMNVKLIKSIDEEWVNEIEMALPSLYEVVMHPRKFIEEQREVVNIAMARNINSESVRHLIQHSDMIDKYDEEGNVVPNRILNVFKEESFNVYENRFVCTLLAELQQFVNKRYNIIFEHSKDELGTFFEMESRVDNYTETVEYKFQVKIRDKQTDLDNEKDNTNIFTRISKIYKTVNSLVNTEFVRIVRGYPAVRHPIVKTNAIGKNTHYKACHRLWNFIYAYDKVGYRVELVKQEPVISRQFEKELYNSFIWNYAMLHNQVDETSKVDVNRDRQQKEADIKYIRQMLDEIIRNCDIPDANLRKIVQNELTNLQAKRKNEIFRLERIRKKNKLAEQQMAQKMLEEEQKAAVTSDAQQDEQRSGQNSFKKNFNSRFKRKKK